MEKGREKKEINGREKEDEMKGKGGRGRIGKEEEKKELKGREKGRMSGREGKGKGRNGKEGR